MNKECKEHECVSGDLVWGDDRNVKFVINENGKYKVQLPENKIATDFHIEENISQINKQEWEDIEKEYENSPKFLDEGYTYQVFLIENYTAPDKK